MPQGQMEEIMSKELIAALDALEKENGISKEVMFEAIEKSLMDEYKTQFNTVENGRVVPECTFGTGELKGLIASADENEPIAGVRIRV